MPLLPHILANADDGSAKVVFGIIFFIIWVVSSLISTAKKKLRQNQPPSVRPEELVELTPRMEVSGPPPRRPGPPGMARPVRPTPLPPPLPAVIPFKPVIRKNDTVLAAPVAAPSFLPPPPATRSSPPKVPSPATSPASKLAKALRPPSLQTQWLLTEVLSKPLALREGDATNLH